MANFELIEAQSRPRAGKGVARATRREGKVPAVIYGAKREPSLIALDPRAVMREMKRGGWRSRLYEISLGGETTRALMRDIQLHPVTDLPEHVDFQRLAAGERIKVAVTVAFLNEGTSPGLKRGGVLNVVRHTIEVACDPDSIPERFEADLSQLDINDNVRWHNLTGTGDSTPVIADRDFVVATIGAPAAVAEVVAEPGAAPAAAAPAKGGKAPAKPAAAAAPAKGAPAKGAAPAKAAPKPAAKKK